MCRRRREYVPARRRKHVPRASTVPKSIYNLPDHDFMEKIVGKRTMKAIDKAVAENNKGIEKIGLFRGMKGS